jgi:hypothetical protein
MKLKYSSLAASWTNYNQTVALLHSASTWPLWLQVLVLGPHGVLTSFMVWAWWPKTAEQWRRTYFILAYLGVFWAIYFLLLR